MAKLNIERHPASRHGMAEVKITGRLYPGKHYFLYFSSIIHKKAFPESVICPFILSEEVQLDNSQFYLYYI